MDYIALGQRIRDLRRKRGLTQEKLAELVDLSVPYISHLERGTKKPIRLAECLGVTVDRLLSGNQAKDTTAFFPEIQELLGDCSVSERAVLTEIAYAAKRSIRVHGVSRPP